MGVIKVTLEYLGDPPYGDVQSTPPEGFVRLSESLIFDNLERLQRYGTMPIDCEDWLRAFGEKLSEQGDKLLYPDSKREQEWLEFVQQFCAAIALMAFFPRGVEILGKRWEASFNPQSPEG